MLAAQDVSVAASPFIGHALNALSRQKAHVRMRHGREFVHSHVFIRLVKRLICCEECSSSLLWHARCQACIS